LRKNHLNNTYNRRQNVVLTLLNHLCYWELLSNYAKPRHREDPVFSLYGLFFLILFYNCQIPAGYRVNDAGCSMNTGMA